MEEGVVVTKENDRIKEIRVQMKTGKPSFMMEAVRICREEGSPVLLLDLMDALREKQIPLVRDSVVSLLNDLSDPLLTPVIAGFLEKNKNHPELQAIVSACWQSRLQFEDHLGIFVDLLLEKDYPVALEAFTVLESFMSGADLPALREHILHMKDRLPGLDPDKQRLVEEMIRMLESHTIPGADPSG